MSNEPALTIGGLAAILVAVASAFDLAIELDTVETVLVALVPLISGLLARGKVTPVQ